MIYVFEGPENQASVVFDGATLTEAQKEKAIQVEALPEKEQQSGKVAVLKADKANNKVWYDYEDEPKDEELETLKNRVADLFELVLLGGVN